MATPDDATTTPAVPVTVLDRLLAAGIGEERARAWIAGGGSRVDGETVIDPGRATAGVVLHPA